MNRSSISAKVVIASFATLLSGCATIPPAQRDGSSPVISGTVRDNLDRPVAGARVSVSGISTLSGRDGRFRVVVRALGPHAMVIKHRDFAYYSRTISGPAVAGAFRLTRASRSIADPTQRIVLRDERRPEDCVAVPSLPGTVALCGRGFGVEIPANSLVDQAGNPPAGPVEIKVATFEIHTESMPAPFVIAASDRDSTAVAIMRPYGAGSVEVRDVRTGRDLRLASGKSARIDIPVHPLARQRTGAAAPPSTIPLLRFDEEMLRWIQIGTMPLVGESYVADVTQLTTFNADTAASVWGCLNIQFWGLTPKQIVNPAALQIQIQLRESNQTFLPGGILNASGGASLYNMFWFTTNGAGSQINFDQHVAYSLEAHHYYWGKAFNGTTQLTDDNQAQSVYLFVQSPLNPPLPAPQDVFIRCTQMNLYWDDKLQKTIPGSWRNYDYLAGPVAYDRTVRIIRSLEDPTPIGTVRRGAQVAAIGLLRDRPWILVRTAKGEIGLASRDGADLSGTRRPRLAPAIPIDDRP